MIQPIGAADNLGQVKVPTKLGADPRLSDAVPLAATLLGTPVLFVLAAKRAMRRNRRGGDPADNSQQRETDRQKAVRFSLSRADRI